MDKLDSLVALKRPSEWLSIGGADVWAIEGLIAKGTINLLQGARETGKSTIALDGAAALAKGEPTWLDRKITDGFPRGVCYMVTDSGAEGEISRDTQALGVPDERITVGRMRRISPSSDPLQWRQFGLNLKSAGCGLVVFDNGTGLVHDINKPEFVNPLFDGLKELTSKDVGLTVVLIHHETATGGKAAGIYSWESEARWRMTITKPGGARDVRKIVTAGNLEGDLPLEIPRAFNVRLPSLGDPSARLTLAGGQGTDELAVKRTARKRKTEKLDRNEEIRRYVAAGHKYRDAAGHFGVSLGTVSQAMSGVQKTVQPLNTE